MKHKPIPELTKNDLVRFWAKVHKQKKCWKWIASTKAKGYGQFSIKSSMYLATRISYAIANSDPGKFCVCHSCDNPNCVNPAHLWIGTIQEDMDDKVVKNRQARGEKNGQSKLTEKQVKEILESDEIHQVLATRYGISRSNISLVKRREAWKHVENKQALNKWKEKHDE